jgi:hypothetical protein
MCFSKFLLATYATCLMTLLNPPVLASPVQIIECSIYLPLSPLPVDSLDLKYTMRRHMIETEPYEEFDTETWGQAKFSNNGTWELDIYPLEGSVRTEHATGLHTTILDGSGVIRDELEDRATSSTFTVKYEGYVVEEWYTVLVKNDGTAIDSHLLYPEEYDPASFDSALCDVVWRVPNGGQPCLGSTGGGNWCTHGTYRGIIQSIRYEEEHEAPHGDGFEINAGLNDAWVNENAPLQGMFLTVYPELKIIFLAWFTFDTVTSQAELMATRWVTAVGSYTGSTAELRAELTTGGIFNGSDPLPTQDTNYGSIDLDFTNCKEAHVSFDFPSVPESGEFTIKRVLEENAALCEALNAE